MRIEGSRQSPAGDWIFSGGDQHACQSTHFRYRGHHPWLAQWRVQRFTKDWPINFGGKPHFSLPAFIPITFELTVLFAAVGMVLTFCYLNQIMPGVKKHVFHPRQTDDTFVVAIELSEHTSEAEVLAFLKSTGANETNVQVAESEWWYGRFDKKEAYELS